MNACVELAAGASVDRGRDSTLHGQYEALPPMNWLSGPLAWNSWAGYRIVSAGSGQLIAPKDLNTGCVGQDSHLAASSISSCYLSLDFQARVL